MSIFKIGCLMVLSTEGHLFHPWLNPTRSDSFVYEA